MVNNFHKENNYKNGYYILAFHLSPDLCSEEHYSMLKDGCLELDFKFDTVENMALNRPFPF